MITIRPGRKVYTIPGPDFGVRVIEPGAVAAAADWWLGPWPNYPAVGAIDSACKEGAYRAVNSAGTPWPGGPATYADTLINLVDVLNPLTEGNGAVPWAQLTGWGFVAAAAQWLDTSLFPTTRAWTVLIQYANAVTSAIFSSFLINSRDADNNTRFGLAFQRTALNQVVYQDSGTLSVLPFAAAANLAIADGNAYRDAVPDGIFAGVSAISTLSLFVGCRNNSGAPDFFCTADIKSVAIYSCTLTPQQVLALADPVLGAMPNL